MLWTLPHNANHTVRQLGLILFLAGIGTRAGAAFWDTLRQGHGLSLLLSGALVTLLVGVATLWIGVRVLRTPMSLLTGMLAGIQTQPAVLAFAQEQAADDLPSVGYAQVYPIAILVKIVLAQVLLALLAR
jgi:putative transport protein